MASEAIQLAAMPSEASAPRRQCILIVGMHRSGTSPITRTLHMLGAALPDHLIKAELDNPDGFWESQDVVRVNQKFLSTIGSNWDDPRPTPAAAYASAAAADCQAEIVALLERDFSATPLFLIKDPRICKLLPIWKAALGRFGAEPLYVLPVRHPVEVARSLNRRNKMPEARALALWFVHAIAAERETRGARRVFVAFDQFFVDPGGASEDLCMRLGCFSESDIKAGRERISAPWSNNRRHHAVSGNTGLEGLNPPLWIRQTYDWELAAASGVEPDPKTLDDIAGSLSDALEIYGPLISAEATPLRRLGIVARMRKRLKR